MLFYGLVPAVLIGLMTGGSLKALAAQQLRLDWLLVLLLAVVAVLPGLDIPLPDRVLVVLAWIVPVLICIIVAGMNLRAPGFALILLGLLLNLMVVAVNLGMPVLVANVALIGAGQEAARSLADSWLHVAADAATHLLVLADVIPIPGPNGLRGMMSLGDLLLMVGVAEFAFLGMHAASDEPGSGKWDS